MPSRADMRSLAENALRGVVMVILAGLLWQSLTRNVAPANADVASRGLASLADWSRLPRPPANIHVELDNFPTPRDRDWLRALAAAGSQVTWTGGIPSLMIAAQPLASPAGGIKVRVAAPSGSRVVVSDEVGVVDTIQTASAGAQVVIPSASGKIGATVSRSVASTVSRDSIALHKVLVLSNAGWESKFVVAALEEEGWKVDAFIRVSPDVDVTQGTTAPIDTSRYSAVIAVDGAASAYANRLVDFARSGGGVIMTPEAAALEALAPLRSGAPNRAPSQARAIQASGSVNLATLALGPITSLRADAVPLEKRSAAVAVAARRINAGRAIQMGYEDTWRWRMGGGDAGLRDHRAWWTNLVSSVAYATRAARTTPIPAVDEAPLAELVSAVGPSTGESNLARLTSSSSNWMLWLFALLSIALLGEVASRRLRGAR